VSYWFGSDTKLPQTRLAIVSYVIVGLTLLLLVGFWKLQIVDSSRYQDLAERNRIRNIQLIAPRGRILDREGHVIVDNYPSFSVLLLRDDMALVNRALPQIADGLHVSIDDLKQQLDAARLLPKYEPIVIKPEASQADIAFIESHKPDLPMIEMVMMHRRKYPSGGFLAAAIGYVGEVSESDIEKSDGKLHPGDMNGKTGLEQQYNETLMGTDGQRRIQVNSVGREVGRLDQIEPVAGKPIQLTIDYDLQVVAENALAGKKGAIVVLDPRNGDILAYVSRPTPDPNDFAVRVSKEEWQRLNTDPDHPMMNRVIQAQLAPGSVFKVIVATAMLESKAIPLTFTAFCPGQANFYGRVFHCWEPKGHGTVNLDQAVARSCDVFFYNVGMRLGIDRMSYYATQFGLGKRTGIDLPGEMSGLMPSEEWVKRVYHRPWYPGETISVAIGQGAVITTPLQLAKAIGGIANGGIFKQPHLLKTSEPVPEYRVNLTEDTIEKITQYMEDVVSPGGTAYTAAHIPGVELCGKTGTAQTISAEGMLKAANRSEHKWNAWFVGFAPRRNPEIVVAVLLESVMKHGSEVAAPLAHDIVKAYYDKKTAREKQQLTASNGGTALIGGASTAGGPLPAPPANTTTQPAQLAAPPEPKPQTRTGGKPMR
jgi:penicillin-binding protein 2